MRMRNLVDIMDLSAEEIDRLIDTASDIAASRSVGVPAAAAAWAQTAELSELRRNRPDLLFTTVAELHAYLQKQLSGDSAGKTEE